ncbi:hypothetical protein ATANTOWER_020960 [Ataeniobius toweri]|uniref:Uncharacterized protein n=1 Tax=Ataeniobius toweri TaxID=208326 RepID=A0ABU7B848_9TELE|nr:hypothetical protein [Ataeniobius toweri]
MLGAGEPNEVRDNPNRAGGAYLGKRARDKNLKTKFRRATRTCNIESWAVGGEGVEAGGKDVATSSADEGKDEDLETGRDVETLAVCGRDVEADRDVETLAAGGRDVEADRDIETLAAGDGSVDKEASRDVETLAAGDQETDGLEVG